MVLPRIDIYFQRTNPLKYTDKQLLILLQDQEPRYNSCRLKSCDPSNILQHSIIEYPNEKLAFLLPSTNESDHVSIKYKLIEF